MGISKTKTLDAFWAFFKSKGVPDEGIAGLAGNIYAESRCNPTCVEELLLRRYRSEGFLSWDKTEYSQTNYDKYTNYLRSGKITEAEFLSPRQYTGKKHQYGYGLAQWTTYARKKKLYDKGNIWDMDTQLQFLYEELTTSFASVWSAINSKSVNASSDYVLMHFEQPANAESMKATRRSYSNEIYNLYKGATMGTTIVKEFSKYIGVKEYNGIVATIQKWYYGSLVKDAWCATSTSYFASVAGILAQIGGKNEGVSQMMAATKALHQKDGRFFEYPNIPKQLKTNDIIFFKRNGASHVAHCWKDVTYTGTGNINVLGGNQSDMICKKDYKQANIQAVYRPSYDTEMKRGDKGADVKDMQNKLKKEGYYTGAVDGDFGAATESGVKRFQSLNRIKVTGTINSETKSLINSIWKGMNTPSKINFTVAQLTNAIKNVHATAKANGYTYGNSGVTPPTQDKIISCDRLEARALWNLGMQDQKLGGETIYSFPAWFEKHGFKKITNPNSLKEGDMVIQGSQAGNPVHMYYVVSYKNGQVNRYDTGSNELIKSNQPVTSPVLWKNRTFYGAYRIGSVTPSGNEKVRQGQAWLNTYYGSTLMQYKGAKLTEDGVYGDKTRAGCVCVWKDLANRKYGAKLSPANENFFESSKAVAKKIRISKGMDGTYPLIIQLVLAGRGYYNGLMDAVFGNATDSAVRAFQKAKKLDVDGVVGAETWYALFN